MVDPDITDRVDTMAGKSRTDPPRWIRLWNRMIDTFNERFRRWNYVYDFDPASPAPAGPSDLRFERYERDEDVPGPVREAIERHADLDTLDWDLREVRDHAVYWIAYLGPELVAKQLIRRGEDFHTWFVPLQAGDLVFFRGWARPGFRGRGIVAALIRHIIAHELPPERRAYTDCRVSNRSSMRMTEKAGFRRIATRRTITREQALGSGASKPS